MSNEIKVSPRYGLNPTISICFWCGKERGEIALMGRIGDGRKGEDLEAPRYSVFDYEPCDSCKEMMEAGFSVFEATDHPNSATSVEIQKGVYPTGRFAVVKPEAANKIFANSDISRGKVFMENQLFEQMFFSQINTVRK